MNSMKGVSAGYANARSSILDAIREVGKVSRTQIADATGLTAATVSKEIKALIAEGLVIETGTAPSTGGRVQVMLELDPSSRYAAGLHLDFDGANAVMMDMGGAVVAHRYLPWANDAEPALVVDALQQVVFDMLADIGADREKLLGIGLVSPGPMQPGEGIVPKRPGFEGWRGYPIADRLRQVSGLPVVVDNDATAAAVGELWTGGARGSTAFSVLYMGSGIGSGTVIDRVAYHGANLSVGEVGHISINLDGPLCWCGNYGCIEAVGGPIAVVNAANAAGVPLTADVSDISAAFAQVAQAARSGDPVAEKLIAESAKSIAAAAQALCAIMSVDLLILSGSAFAEAGDLYLKAVQQQVARSIYSLPNSRVEISANASRSPAIGAAALVLQHQLVPRQFAARLATNNSTNNSTNNHPNPTTTN